jgi:hypothetical protein
LSLYAWWKLYIPPALTFNNLAPVLRIVFVCSIVSQHKPRFLSLKTRDTHSPM